MRRFVKKMAATGLVAAITATAPTAMAANAQTTVEVNLPTVLVMYHYDQIQLQVSSPALTNFLTGSAATACGSDSCDNLTGTLDMTATPLADLSAASVDAQISDTNPALAAGSTTATFTVANAVGVRALGCTNYTSTVTDGGSDAPVTIDTANSLSGIAGAGCGLAMTVGDLMFDVDFSDAGLASQVNAVFDITVTGI